MLAKHGAAARVLAGGTDLIIQAREGRRDVAVMVDVKGIAEATQLSLAGDGSLRIGAATSCSAIYHNKDVAKAFPALIDSASLIGSVQIRRGRASAGTSATAARPAIRSRR